MSDLPTDNARRTRARIAKMVLAVLLAFPAACSDAPDEGIPREPFSEDPSP